ncbi:MAG TPA: phosphoenolpyruvate--protein phosphotransferase [Vicinamibacteria bacterium]|nr:phosphoenolpyruvate--protein phosphotransferase [Vicinamibacteria bacterium]
MRLDGIAVSPGVAVGPALIVEREAVPVFRLLVPPEAVDCEVHRLTRAVEASRQQITAIKDRLREAVGPHAYIFDAHLLMLDDPLLLDQAVNIIRQEQVNAEWALRTVSAQLHEMFEGFTDAYLRERTTDLDDVLGRIQLNLGGAADAPSLAKLPGHFVIVAVDLTPSQAAELDWEHVLAVATDTGSPSHHTSILARSFGIPAVVGLQDATSRIPPGSTVAVDGTRGEVVIEPAEPALAALRAAHGERRSRPRAEGSVLPCVTQDGMRVRLMANAEFPEEAVHALEYGAEGIGLFRSEYLLGRARHWPAEERQYEVYRRMVEQLAPHPITVRTWDVGPDDLVPGGPTSTNPALGERALRLMRRVPEPFRAQLRALFRAAAHGPLCVMFPFVTGPSDLRLVMALIEETRDGLRRDGVPFAEDVPIGLMLEVPSAAATADLLAPHVQFFAVGTNDLIQYLLAVDRVDPRVSSLYEPLHPAVLRTIDGVARVASVHALPLSICGEMAADPLLALLLLGLGVRELSMSPAAIPAVKAAIRGASLGRLEELARAALSLATAPEIEAMLRRELAEPLATPAPS